MNEEELKHQIAQADVCRCCLISRGTWKLTSTNCVNDDDTPQSFYEKLRECYGIKLSCLSEKEASHSICESCTAQLESAYNFRQQVLRADENFAKYWDKGKRLGIKSEPTTSTSNFYFLDTDAVTYDEAFIEESKSERDIQKPKLVACTRQKRKVKTYIHNIIDNNSSMPIAVINNGETGEETEIDEEIDSVNHIKTKRKVKFIQNKIDHSLEVLKAVNENTIQIKNTVNENEHDIQPNKDETGNLNKQENETLRNTYLATGTQFMGTMLTKTISERKRIILTCSVVLKETTACPFRHHKSWFQCFYCTQEFMDMRNIRIHIKKDHHDVESELCKMKRFPRTLQIDISDLECRQCNLNLKDVESMRHHFEISHEKIIYKEFIADYKVDVSPYSCHLCKEEFHVFRTLTTHLNEHYANCICDICGRSFINAKRLKVHKRTHEKGHFPCNVCGKVLNTKTSQANHMEGAHSKRQLKCQICLKPMKHYNDRIKHMSEAHNITHVFKCKVCFKEYNIKHYLATHMRQTHGNKNKKCLECDMMFITNHGLKKHMSKHTGMKAHICIVCGKAYARSYTLREHMRNHENEKGFV